MARGGARLNSGPKPKVQPIVDTVQTRIAVLNDPEPPENLSDESKTFWKSISGEYTGFDDPASARRLATVCESFDRMREAQALIKEHGAVKEDRFGQLKVNPATVVERDSRAAMMAALKALKLDSDVGTGL